MDTRRDELKRALDAAEAAFRAANTDATRAAFKAAYAAYWAVTPLPTAKRRASRAGRQQYRARNSK